MRKKLVSILAGTLLLGVSGAANAAAVSLAGLNDDFTGHASLTDSWFYNFNGVRYPGDDPSDLYGNRHLPTNGPTPNGGYDVLSSGSNEFVYGEALKANGDTTNGLSLTVSGGVDFGTSISTGSRIIEDIWNSSSRKHHGIGVYPDGDSSSEEQVNADVDFNQFLILDFNQSVNLAGFDFAGGDHYGCDSSSNNCGGWELYDFSTGVLGAVLASGSLVSQDFDVFAPITGKTFALRSVMGQGSGESGWYLSGVAGDISAVPVPLPFAMFFAALAWLGLAGRGRTSAKS